MALLTPTLVEDMVTDLNRRTSPVHEEIFRLIAKIPPERRESEDTPENRRLAEARALIISREMKDSTFDYLHHFPAGNKHHVFVREQRPASNETVESYYEKWLPRQKDRVLPHRLKDYESQFRLHILPARIDGTVFGRIPLSALTTDHLVKLQATLRAKKQPNKRPYKANSINSFIGGSLRGMLKDARRIGRSDGKSLRPRFLRPVAAN